MTFLTDMLLYFNLTYLGWERLWKVKIYAVHPMLNILSERKDRNVYIQGILIDVFLFAVIYGVLARSLSYLLEYYVFTR